MCGRYTLTYSDLGEVADLLGAILDPTAAAIHRPRYNVAPTSVCIVARPAAAGDGRAALVPARWGLQVSGRFLINLRGEAAAKRVREARARCVIPADGFYEWTGEKRDRRPIWFHDPAGRPLFMAGLIQDGGDLHSPGPAGPDQRPVFAVLTAPSRPPVAAIHARMPVLLSTEGARRWLSESAGPPAEVQGDDVPLLGTEVSPRVNATTHDDPACLAPPGAAPGKGKQLGLF